MNLNQLTTSILSHRRRLILSASVVFLVLFYAEPCNDLTSFKLKSCHANYFDNYL